jgi:hypothetical protein
LLIKHDFPQKLNDQCDQFLPRKMGRIFYIDFSVSKMLKNYSIFVF